MEVTVHPHAIERWREQTGSKKSDSEVAQKILSMFALAKETHFLRPFKETLAIMRHHFEIAKYFKRASWVFVVVDCEIKTCYEDIGKRFARVKDLQSK